MKKRLTSLAVTTSFLLMATPVPAGQDCGERLKEKCTACHYQTRICEKVGKKDRRAWKNSTKRMIRYGLKIKNAEIDEITECLVSMEGNPDIFCAE